MDQMIALTPELLVLLAALVALFATALGGDRVAAGFGAVVSAVAAVLVWTIPAPASAFGGMLVFSLGTPALLVRSGVAGLTALFLVWVFARGWAGHRAREAVSLALFSTLGSMLLVSAADILVMFFTLELSAMAAYILIGYARDERRSLEGALKYFLMSVMTSLLMAYGLSFVYGMSGTTAYREFAVAGPEWVGVLVSGLVLVGFLAKMTAAPFHYWIPDASEGAPTTSVAYVSTIAKIAPTWAMVRFLAEVLPGSPGLFAAVLAAAVLSIVWGTLAALTQQDLRRMVAYSGIANTGYMLLGVSAATAAGYASAVYFMAAYALGALGLLLVVAQEGATLQDVAGLVKRRPYAAWTSVIFLFSIIGFPPFVGFYGKLAVFSAAYNAGHVWAVVAAILMSVVAGGYAFNVIRAMFTPGEGAPAEVEWHPLESRTEYPQAPAVAATTILVLGALTLGLGLWVEPVLEALATVLR